MKYHKIVLAGGNGYLGTVLAGYYKSVADEVIILSRHPKPADDKVKTLVWDGKHEGDWLTELENTDRDQWLRPSYKRKTRLTVSSKRCRLKRWRYLCKLFVVSYQRTKIFRFYRWFLYRSGCTSPLANFYGYKNRFQNRSVSNPQCIKCAYGYGL